MEESWWGEIFDSAWRLVVAVPLSTSEELGDHEIRERHERGRHEKGNTDLRLISTKKFPPPANFGDLASTGDSSSATRCVCAKALDTPCFSGESSCHKFALPRLCRLAGFLALPSAAYCSYNPGLRDIVFFIAGREREKCSTVCGTGSLSLRSLRHSRRNR